MGKANFIEDFNRDAVVQITERGYPVAEVAARLGIGKYSLHEWRKRYGKPKDRVLVHSDQASHFTRMEWASFLKDHDLQPSMSRRGNCHDNAVAESFFNLLKRDRIRGKV